VRCARKKADEYCQQQRNAKPTVIPCRSGASIGASNPPALGDLLF